MATILITGGSGLIGTHISERLAGKGHDIIILTRNAAGRKVSGRISFAEWDPEKQTLDEAAFSKADHIIHLAGAGVADKRWSDKRKKEIRDSRIKSGELLIKMLDDLPNKIKTFVSSSAIGWYGPDPEIPNTNPFTETNGSAPGFLGETCRDWEASVSKAGKSTRLVIIRTGIVLANEGGALKEFKKPLMAGMAAILGSGKQIVSWIHIDDLVNIFIYALENEALRGIYNAVAPAPVSNKELTLALAKAKRKFFIPFKVPSFLLKIILGEMSIEVLKSATVSAEKIAGAGFRFKFPSIEEAMKDLAVS